jgi:hexosaminidase
MKSIILLLLCSTAALAQAIIPAPVSYQGGQAMFMFTANTKVVLLNPNPEVEQIAQLLASTFSTQYQKMEVLKTATLPPNERVISLELNKTPDKVLGNEGYVLEVLENQIKMTANKPAGLFYAMQSLRQMLPPMVENKEMGLPYAPIMGCKITDYPRFGWRGLMLDVSRHFFSKDEVKQYIDMMARYKFNILHWHLTDDNGWRIEIKSLPKLTEVGAWRVERAGHYGERPDPKPDEKATYGGFYTQEDIKEVVKYAAERQIAIVPEIDVPGHSMAALAAYPELSCRKETKYVNPGTKFSEWYGNGTFKMLIENTLNPADEKVYEFLDKVFGEVAKLFPHRYIHIGGDESYHGYWEEDKGCQELMKKKNLKNGHELQSYFMKRLEKIILSKGKKMMGWDEILEGGLAPEAAVMSWRGMKGGIEAAKQGHEVVMTPTQFCYLDYTQGDRSVEFPIYSSLSLRKTYEFEPLPMSDSVKIDNRLILGGQGNLWTEQIPTLRHAFYMTYPRAFAIAERLWSENNRTDWNDFTARVENHFQRFDSGKISISKAIYDPVVKVYKNGDKLMCELKSEIEGTEIFYTMNDTFPDNFSTKYTQAFEVPVGDVTLKVINYRSDRPIGRELTIKRDELLRRAKL